jgi:polar amino acid transport system ATP-binding protein
MRWKSRTDWCGLGRARHDHIHRQQPADLQDRDIPPGPQRRPLDEGPRLGSGKSTLLRCINHLEAINKGYIAVDGEQIGYRLRKDRLEKLSANGIARQRRKIGMVFQQFNLYPHMTVLQNIIEAPVGIHGESRPEATRNALKLLERVGLSE